MIMNPTSLKMVMTGESVVDEFVDPLAGCLLFLSKHYSKPASAAFFKHGLPLKNGMLTPALFSRAARRCGLNASLHSKQLDNLSGLLLPCVLLLEDNQACVLLEFKADEDKALIAQPESVDNVYELPLADLNQRYTGRCFFVRKRYQFDTRSPKLLDTKEGHWFWRTIFLSAPLYKEALLASFLVNLFMIAPAGFSVRSFSADIQASVCHKVSFFYS
jgi:ATP-binding cassette subfamily C protein LapB